MSISQPVLRGWGLRINRTNLELARGNHRLSQAEFEQSVIATIAGVETAYWDLVFAISDLEVNQESLDLAEEQLDRNRIQVEVGTMAPIEITQARAEVASREEGIIVAQTAIENNQDTLKTSLQVPLAQMLESHRRALAAIAAGDFKDETVAVDLPGGKLTIDEGPRPDTSKEALAALKPAFQERGTVTAGNSSQKSDGAAAVLVMESRLDRPAHFLAQPDRPGSGLSRHKQTKFGTHFARRPSVVDGWLPSLHTNQSIQVRWHKVPTCPVRVRIPL